MAAATDVADRPVAPSGVIVIRIPHPAPRAWLARCLPARRRFLGEEPAKVHKAGTAPHPTP